MVTTRAQFIKYLTGLNLIKSSKSPRTMKRRTSLSQIRKALFISKKITRSIKPVRAISPVLKFSYAENFEMQA